MSGSNDKKKQPGWKPFQKPSPDIKVTETVEEKLARLEKEIGAPDIVSSPASSAGSQVTVKSDSVSGSLSSSNTSQALEQAASQISFMHNPRVNMFAFWFIVIASVILTNVPGISFLLTPVNQFVTMVHELSHAIATVITGGHVLSMTVTPDGQGHGGLTNSAGGWSFLIVQAGYVGTTMFGCLLIYLAQYPRLSKLVLSALGVVMVASSLLFMTPGLFNPMLFFQAFGSLLWGLGMGGACIYMGRKLKPAWANLAVLFLAIQTALSSLSLIWILVPHALGLAGGGFTDATTMADIVPFTLPVFWAFLWIALSISMLFITLKHTYGAALLKKQIKKKL